MYRGTPGPAPAPSPMPVLWPLVAVIGVPAGGSAGLWDWPGAGASGHTSDRPGRGPARRRRQRGCRGVVVRTARAVPSVSSPATRRGHRPGRRGKASARTRPVTSGDDSSRHAHRAVTRPSPSVACPVLSRQIEQSSHNRRANRDIRRWRPHLSRRRAGRTRCSRWDRSVVVVALPLGTSVAGRWNRCELRLQGPLVG